MGDAKCSALSWSLIWFILYFHFYFRFAADQQWYFIYSYFHYFHFLLMLKACKQVYCKLIGFFRNKLLLLLFFVKNWSHEYWLAWGFDDTCVFYSASLIGLGWSSLTLNIRFWCSKSWISNSKNSKPCFICLSYRHVQTTWQQKSLQSFSYFSFKDFKKVRNFSFMKLKLEKLVDAVRKTFTHLSPQ